MATVYRYDDSAELAHNVGKFILQKQAKALSKKDTFNIAISGGSLVKVLNKCLVQDKELADKIQWFKWNIYFCDERIVALEHEDSNYGAFKTSVLDPLLDGNENLGPTVYAINESLVGLNENDKIAEEYESLLPQGDGGMDLILLGCGPDGHTCSLFPGEKHKYLLDESNKKVAWCHDSPKPPSDRITFTLPVLQASDALCFVAEGSGKKEIMKQIFQDRDTTLPCALINELYENKVSWFVNDAAVDGVAVATTKF